MEYTAIEKIRRTYNNIYKEMDELYHTLAVEKGISDSVMWILYMLCEQGEGYSQAAICKEISISKQTIHSAIRKLHTEGFIYFKQGKGRDKYIYLTESGKVMMEEKILPITAIENAAFLGMEQREREELLRLTEKYVHLLQAEYKNKKES